MKIEKLEVLVKEVLESNKATREDDHLLFVEIVYKLKPEYVNSNFLYVFKNARQLGLPPFESVSRCRRKLQAEYEELKPSVEVQEARDNKEMDMFEYALRKEVV